MWRPHPVLLRPAISLVHAQAAQLVAVPQPVTFVWRVPLPMAPPPSPPHPASSPESGAGGGATRASAHAAAADGGGADVKME